MFAVMDDKGIIESFDNLDDAMSSLDHIRNENKDIKGDLQVIKILYIDN